LPNVRVENVNVTGGEANMRRFVAELQRCGFDSGGVPVVIVRGECFQGWGPDTVARVREILSR
jgi:hypothetical protein